MNNRIKLYFAKFLVVAAGLWLTSCSASDDSLGSDKGADVAKNEKVLTLRINTGATSFGSRTTDITTDPGATAENTINRLTIGIFDSNGTTAKCIKELTETGSEVFLKQNNGAVANIVASSLTAGDKVLVAVNAPAGTFSGVSNVASFNAKTEGTVAALTYTKASEAENAVEEKDNIPMYGDGTLAAGANGKDFTATIPVKHLLSKVTLENLSVDFEKTGSYKAATFTPTRIFLINEPDMLLFNNDAWETTTNSLFQGYDQADTKHGTYKECLTTGTLVGNALSGDKTATNTCKLASKYFFYTMPNNEINTGGKNTKLVIAGLFKSNGSGNGNIVYYPVSLNAVYKEDGTIQVADPNTALYKVYPNKNYKCSVVIKAKGADNPFADLDPKKAAITVTVTGFQDVTQTTVFK